MSSNIDPADLIPPSEGSGDAAPADPYAAWREAGLDLDQMNPQDVARTLQFANSLLDESTRAESLENAMRHWGMLQEEQQQSAQQPRLPQAQGADDDWSSYQDPYAVQPPPGLTQEQVAKMLDERLQQQQQEFDNRLAINELRRNVEGQMADIKAAENLTDSEQQFLATRVAERLNTSIQQMDQGQINSIVRSTWDEFMTLANARLAAQVQKTEQAPRTTTPRGQQPANGDGAGWGLAGAMQRTASQLGMEMDS